MEFGKLTRGDGKIYIALRADVPSGAQIRVSSRAQNGNDMPALALRGEHSGSYVVVVPVISLAQVVTAHVVDGQGKTLDSAMTTVDPKKSAWQSKRNTLLKDAATSMRNIDADPRIDCANIRIDRIVLFDDATNLLHGFICLYAPNYRNEALNNANIRFVGTDGSLLESSKVTVFGESPIPVTADSPDGTRLIEFSFRLPVLDSDFFIWVSFPGGSAPDGFIRMEASRIEQLRRDFFFMMSHTSQGEAYDDWFRRIHRTSPLVIEAQKTAHFEIEPLFSIIVPLYKTPLGFFWEMVESVRSQTYAKWELVLVNASPEDSALCENAQRAVAEDERIRLVTLDENKGITLNTNEGIRAAKGDFLCFFDHDDILEPDALFEYAKGINRYPDTDLLYCDEDKIENGHYFDGFLKPDFDMDLLTASNYVCHMLTVRTSLVRDLPELPGKEFDGAQDHNLTFLIAEQARNVYHVRKVLYHWRVHQQSTAGSADSKPWAQEAGNRAIEAHFKRIGVPVKVEDSTPAFYHRVKYIMPEEQPLVSIVIPTKDHIDLLSTCVDSILEKTTYRNFEIVLVENNSTEEQTFAYYDKITSRDSRVKVVRYEGEFNFSAICNFGARHASGDYYLFLNNDTSVITPEWIERMLGPMLHRSTTACTGAMLLYADDTIQHAGVIIPKANPDHLCHCFPADSLYHFSHLQRTRESSAVTGACMLVRASQFDAVDGFDERFAVAYNDIDLCLRLRECGWSVVMEPTARLYHYESASRGSDFMDPNKFARLHSEGGLFRERWGKYISAGDPFYGMHCARESTRYELDWLREDWELWTKA